MRSPGSNELRRQDKKTERRFARSDGVQRKRWMQVLKPVRGFRALAASFRGSYRDRHRDGQSRQPPTASPTRTRFTAGGISPKLIELERSGRISHSPTPGLTINKDRERVVAPKSSGRPQFRGSRGLRRLFVCRVPLRPCPPTLSTNRNSRPRYFHEPRTPRITPDASSARSTRRLGSNPRIVSLFMQHLPRTVGIILRPVSRNYGPRGQIRNRPLDPESRNAREKSRMSSRDSPDPSRVGSRVMGLLPDPTGPKLVDAHFNDHFPDLHASGNCHLPSAVSDQRSRNDRENSPSNVSISRTPCELQRERGSFLLARYRDGFRGGVHVETPSRPRGALFLFPFAVEGRTSLDHEQWTREQGAEI